MKSGHPKEHVKIDLKSKPYAIVSVLAIDKKLTFISNNHEVTKQNVIDALTNTKKYFHAKNANSSDVTFDKSNHNFIINLALNTWRTCTPEEIKLIGKMDDPTINVRNSNGGSFIDIDEEEPPEEIPAEEEGIEDDEPDVRTKFPETWLWETSRLEKNSDQIEAKIPDSITTWVFTGFSIHKNFGFAIAKPQELTVSQEFFIDLNLPYSIKFGEVFELEVIAFNFVKTNNYTGDVNVVLKVIAQHQHDTEEQFEFKKFKDRSESCETIPVANTTQSINLSVPHRTGTRSKFLIKPLLNKEISIRVEAVATSSNGKMKWHDKLVKKLRVENEGVAYYDTNNYEYKLNNEKKFNSHSFVADNVKEGSIELAAIITGDMMGPALNFYSGLL